MGAALAYYALFSLFPVVLILLSIFGFWVGSQSSIYAQILSFSRQNLPPNAHEIILDVLSRLNSSSTGAGIVGFALLMFSASGFFSALDRDFDKIWKVKKRQTAKINVSYFAWTYISRKFFSFLLVLSISGLILISQTLNIGINILDQIIQAFSDKLGLTQLENVQFLQGLQLGVSFLLLLGTVMILFKVLPSTRVQWCDVWFGALITSLLFTILQHLVSNSIVVLGMQFQSYGVVGSIMVLMIWLYLSSQIILIGGEVTYVFSRIFGSHLNHRI